MKTVGFWIIGDGKIIRAWEDSWLGQEFRLIDHLETIPGHLINSKVRDLVAQDGDWDFSMMDSWMPVHLRDKIKVCVPPSMDHITEVFLFCRNG